MLQLHISNVIANATVIPCTIGEHALVVLSGGLS